MRRALLTILFALSLILWIGATLMWARSWFVREAYPESVHGNGWSIRSWDGRVFLIHLSLAPAPSPHVLVRMRTPTIAGDSRNPDDTPAARIELQRIQQFGDGVIFTAPRITLPPASLHNWFGYGRASVQLGAATGTTMRVSVIAIPYWMIFGLTLFFPAAWLLFRVRRSPIPGKCTACGYDLRATPNRCPECGTIAPHT